MVMIRRTFTNPRSRTAGRPSKTQLAEEYADSPVIEFPDGAPVPDGLTERQRRILYVIQEAIRDHGYPPAVREICEAVGLTSSSSVHHQLKVLQEKGFIRRDPNRPRAIEVVLPQAVTTPPSTSITGDGDGGVSVPLLGRIAAGSPILATEQLEDVMTLPRQLVGQGTLFMLEVRGDSMVDAAICDGDYVVVRQQAQAEDGEIVAAMIDGEATVKTLQHKDGHVWLLPHNPAYTPIDGDQATILGKVVSVLRRV